MNNKSKRILPIILVVVLSLCLALFLVACGDKGGDNNPDIQNEEVKDEEVKDEEVNYVVTIHPNNGGENVVWNVTDPIPTFKLVGKVIDSYYLDENFTSQTNINSLTSNGLTKDLDIFIKWKDCSHTFEDGICSICEAIQTEGLVFEKVDGYYELTSYGTAKGDIHIPKTYNNLPVKSIGKNVFANSKDVISVEIPSTVTSIKENAFNKCLGLKSIIIPENVSYIGSNAFKSSGLTCITVKCKELVAESDAFSKCEKLILVINMSPLTLQSRSTNYGNLAYYSVEIVGKAEDSTLLNGDYIIYSGTGFKYLGAYLGFDSEIEIESGTTNIADYAFYGCDFIKSIKIPVTVTTLGDAFINCSQTLTINFDGTKAEWEAIINNGSDTLNYNVICSDGTTSYYTEE